MAGFIRSSGFFAFGKEMTNDDVERRTSKDVVLTKKQLDLIEPVLYPNLLTCSRFPPSRNYQPLVDALPIFCGGLGGLGGGLLARLLWSFPGVPLVWSELFAIAVHLFLHSILAIFDGWTD